MNCRRVRYLPVLVTLIAEGIAAGPSVCVAQSQMSYMLLESSTLVEDCPICGRPPLIMPLRGTFQLVFREQDPLFTIYDVKDISFEGGSGAFTYTVIGEGTYEIGGEVAAMQRMQLTAQINDVSGIELESRSWEVPRPWPIVEIDVAEEVVDPFTQLIVFSMHIVAAPVREVWFSTTTGFTSGTLKQPLSPGDLLSHTGRVVKKNSHLVGRLGIMPIVPDLGLDAFDVAAGGECLFSFSYEDGVFSEVLGHLHDGDLLSDGGRIVRTNQHLTSAFGLMPPVPDVGLDAVHVMEDGEILFSIGEKMFSEKLGVTLYPGDLLSDKGAVVRTNEQLLANFEPLDGQGDVGLDVIHVWPNGEIWFSTEAGFQSKRLGPVGDGDLLSDSGWIIFRNLELLQQFEPLEDLADFGLDSLFLVTESHSKEPSVTRPKIILDQEFGDVWIEWESDGKVFQVERADDPRGPYIPLNAIAPGTDYLDLAAALGKTKSFYRLREW
jgi:hypothetical protein